MTKEGLREKFERETCKTAYIDYGDDELNTHYSYDYSAWMESKAIELEEEKIKDKKCQYMEKIGHEVLSDMLIGCVVCGDNRVELSHIRPQTKVNLKLAGVALDIIGLNVMPMCKQHHMEQHAGKIFSITVITQNKCLHAGREQLQRYLARGGK